jgi:hypothetical protein
MATQQPRTNAETKYSVSQRERLHLRGGLPYRSHAEHRHRERRPLGAAGIEFALAHSSTDESIVGHTFWAARPQQRKGIEPSTVGVAGYSGRLEDGTVYRMIYPLQEREQMEDGLPLVATAYRLNSVAEHAREHLSLSEPEIAALTAHLRALADYGGIVDEADSDIGGSDAGE